MLKEVGFYAISTFFEILGCFGFWQVIKNSKSYAWFGIGAISLVIFAYILTRVESEFVGRAYAAYGGIYIISSLIWLFVVKKQQFSKFDIIGASLAILGACVIIYGIKRA